MIIVPDFFVNPSAFEDRKTNMKSNPIVKKSILDTRLLDLMSTERVMTSVSGLLYQFPFLDNRNFFLPLFFSYSFSLI